MLVFALYPFAKFFDPTLEWRELVKVDLRTGMYLFSVIALGSAYNYLSLREISNKRYHREVNINLRKQALHALPPEERVLDSYRWKDVRSIFYYLVDRDPSLEKQASRAYWNGLAWTSFADLRAISCVFTILYMISYFVLGANLFLSCALVALGLFATSFIFSAISTRRHQEIGNEQIEYILVHYRQELAEKLRQVAGRTD
jgi:hypothetical protein